MKHFKVILIFLLIPLKPQFLTLKLICRCYFILYTSSVQWKGIQNRDYSQINNRQYPSEEFANITFMNYAKLIVIKTSARNNSMQSSHSETHCNIWSPPLKEILEEEYARNVCSINLTTLLRLRTKCVSL